ncbi:hypothetical protein M413DRAFT_203572 [Hebeloma cylindrosporum]|uniref:Uncharacterized protein n=1 Tax=Hebeloma cylindrosporum TaxID=76867 RepID=A0A0C2Z2Q8_HEBCY|nr:hypothetical protein M413DRAFT_203572 [Hebeloma cylindrosporum h7]
MSGPKITTSKSTLMHACLAYMSPELNAIDYIIRGPYTKSNPRQVTLPTEILLLIRGWLFPTITAHLIKQSMTALAVYEQSLRDLLCADCIAYNVDIYGQDIWQWEQFSGACSCNPGSDNQIPFQHTHRTTLRNSTRNSRMGRHIISLDPQQFVDAEHWLESYLYQTATLFEANRRGHEWSVPSGTRSAPPTDIWDVVHSALREYDCEVTGEFNERKRTRNRAGRDQFLVKRKLVQVVPSHFRDKGHPSSDTSWRAEANLRRAGMDLGLLLEHPHPPIIPVKFSPHSTRRLRWPSASNSCYKGQDIVELFQTFFQILASLLAACLSLPITFAILALTIVCFYSRPRSFRIL